MSPEAGGRLEVEGVRLYLPPGAVEKMTIVRMTVYEGGFWILDRLFCK